jgi:hypothetical protein
MRRSSSFCWWGQRVRLWMAALLLCAHGAAVPAQAPDPAASMGLEVWRFNHLEDWVVVAPSKCGYTVGVYYRYQPAGAASAGMFHLIRRHSPPEKTFYCGVPLQQTFDAAQFLPWGLTDGRLMLVDWLAKIVIIVRQPPSSVINIDDTLLLMPGKLLFDALQADHGDQPGRYRTLLSVIKAHPPRGAGAIRAPCGPGL